MPSIEHTKPIVAIVGRPNVGKSTLFNRLVGKRHAIVSELPGTTRDRVTAETDWQSTSFVLVDTGGLDEFPQAELWSNVRNQIQIAIDEADVIIMVVDVHSGITISDLNVAEALRRSIKPVVLATNKTDNETRIAESVEFYELGLGDPIPVSAYHNVGMEDLMEKVLSHLPESLQLPTPNADIRLAIVGRTNMGKSMLVNTITGDDRAIVSEIPGTTRDSLDTMISDENGSILLIDTAGIRRRGKILPGIEHYSTLRTIRAIDRADIAVLLLDASELARSQDTHVAKYILDAYKGIVLAVNKWDLASKLGLDMESSEREVRKQFGFAQYSPIRFISATEGTGINELLQTVRTVHSQWCMTLPRYGLRRTILNAVADHPPSLTGRHSLKVYGVTQDQSSPPSFTFYVNRTNMVHFSYRRYLENSIRNVYGFNGTPLRMRFKGRDGK